MEIHSTFVQYQVGKPYPLHNRATGADKSVAQLNALSFDVLAYYKKPSPKEIKAFKAGRLRYGIYYDQQFPHIPFFIIDFPELSSNFDVSINMFKGNASAVEIWLAYPSNSVTLYLIDAKTNILKVQRLCGLDASLMAEMKAECAKQLEFYSSPADVDYAILNVMNTVPTEVMIRNIRMYTLK